MQAQICCWKTFTGKTLKNKKGTQIATKKCYTSSVLQSNTFFKTELSAKENSIKPTSINP